MIHHTLWSWAWWIHMLGWDLGGKYGHIVPYDPWSGSVSDFGLIGVTAGLFTHSYAYVRKNNCEVHRCWRLARHDTAAGHHVCRKHHPDDHLTAEAVAVAHRSELEKAA